MKPLLYHRQGLALLSCLCVLLGAMMSLVVKDKAPVRAGSEEVTIERIQGLLDQRASLTGQRDALMSRVQGLEAEITAYERQAAQDNTQMQQLVERKDQMRMEAGFTKVTGPGVEITLDDRNMEGMLIDPYTISSYIVHDSDLLEVINELKAAGALAVEVNGARIIGSTRVSCGGPTINVGPEQRFTPPFVIHAVGDPDKLTKQFDSPDSIYQLLLLFGLRFEIKKMDSIEIPAYLGNREFTYAQPVEEGQ